LGNFRAIADSLLNLVAFFAPLRLILRYLKSCVAAAACALSQHSIPLWRNCAIYHPFAPFFAGSTLPNERLVLCGRPSDLPQETGMHARERTGADGLIKKRKRTAYRHFRWPEVKGEGNEFFWKRSRPLLSQTLAKKIGEFCIEPLLLHCAPLDCLEG
jgi:hypothetical protein